MTSTNDTTILAMFCQHPNIPETEINCHIDKLEHSENINIGKALLGIVAVDSLTENQKTTYLEIKRWSANRICRIRNEQILSRRKNQANKLKEKMIDLYEQGKISNEMMMLYAISGPLPDVLEYRSLRPEQKEDFWTSRIEQRLGDVPQNKVNWRELRGNMKEWLKFEDTKVDWKKEGF